MPVFFGIFDSFFSGFRSHRNVEACDIYKNFTIRSGWGKYIFFFYLFIHSSLKEKPHYIAILKRVLFKPNEWKLHSKFPAFSEIAIDVFSVKTKRMGSTQLNSHLIFPPIIIFKTLLFLCMAWTHFLWNFNFCQWKA